MLTPHVGVPVAWELSTMLITAMQIVGEKDATRVEEAIEASAPPSALLQRRPLRGLGCSNRSRWRSWRRRVASPRASRHAGNASSAWRTRAEPGVPACYRLGGGVTLQASPAIYALRAAIATPMPATSTAPARTIAHVGTGKRDGDGTVGG